MHKSYFNGIMGCLALVLCATRPAYPLRMSALPPDAGFSVVHSRVEIKPAPARLAAANVLDDVRVCWDAKTGVPNSIRGPGLRLVASTDGTVPELQAIAAMQALAPVYGIRDTSSELQAYCVQLDKTGGFHVRMRQFNNGLRVVGGSVLAHFNAENRLCQVSGRYVPDLNINRNPIIDANSAMALAKIALAQHGLAHTESGLAPELVVYALDATPALAYEINLCTHTPESGVWRVWIDAQSGMILRAYDRMPRANQSIPNSATITGRILATEGNLNVTVTGCKSENRYYLQHYSLLHNSLWRVFNASFDLGYADSRATANRTNADWSNSDGFEMSAMLNFGLVDEYFRTTHNRKSFDDGRRFNRAEGEEAVANVHVDGGHNNAYWHPLYQQFYFYPGDQYEMADTAVLDVCAHEYTHAVNQYSANMDYYSESGALNESFSDIFGVLVEFASQPDGRHLYPGKQAGTADWLLGEDAYLQATSLRDLRDPGSMTTLAPGSQQPSRYHGTNWYYGIFDNAGVHINSGVQSKFFYLLCEGGNGINDGIEYSIIGIGISNAAHIAYRTLTVYCTEYGTDYETVREYWLSAAADLNPAWTTAVEQAWSAVGVGTTPVPGASLLALYEPCSGQWHINTMNDMTLTSGENWGGPGFTPLLMECNAGGLPELVVYCEAAGTWYVASLCKMPNLKSRGYALHVCAWGVSWGGPGMMPVPGDYDGDGNADLALFHGTSGAWYIASLSEISDLKSQMHALSVLAWGVATGATGCVAVPGDYDGDGCADLAAYDPMTGAWIIHKTNCEVILEGFVCGGPGLMPVPGDFDGDGLADLALYSAATGRWYVFSLAAGWLVWDEAWGGPGLVPVSGDYDGDGITDISVYDTASGRWYVRTRSGKILLWNKVFGNSTMMPVNN